PGHPVTTPEQAYLLHDVEKVLTPVGARLAKLFYLTVEVHRHGPRVQASRRRPAYGPLVEAPVKGPYLLVQAVLLQFPKGLGELVLEVAVDVYLGDSLAGRGVNHLAQPGMVLRGLPQDAVVVEVGVIGQAELLGDSGLCAHKVSMMLRIRNISIVKIVALKSHFRQRGQPYSVMRKCP